jgi:hypothetical protein
MLDLLMKLVGLVGLVWFGWSALALFRGASNGRGKLLWQLGGWQLISAFGAVLVLTSGALSALSIIGLVLMVINPVFWKLGNVSNRLKSHGVRLNDVLWFR